MTDGPHSPKRMRLDTDLTKMSKEELIDKIRELHEYMTLQESRHSGRHGTAEDDEARETEESLKKQNMEAARRENTLVLRLTSKEQELQDCLNQIAEMKQSQTQSVSQLRQMLLDPAVNLIYQRMAREMDKLRENLKQTQNDLSAWKFTADSQTGKRLMAKCRMLLQENEDLGRMINSGRTAKLEGEIAMQKNLVQEMKGNQSEMELLVGELEEDMEGLQSMIYALQRQLKETREQLTQCQAENASLREQLKSQPPPSTSTPADPSPSLTNTSPRGVERQEGGGAETRGEAQTSDTRDARTFSEDIDMETDTGGGTTATEGEEGGREEEEMEHTDSDCLGRRGEEQDSEECGEDRTGGSTQLLNHGAEAGRTAGEEGLRTWGAASDSAASPATSPGVSSPTPLTHTNPSPIPGLGEKRTPVVGEDGCEESDGTEPISNGVSTDPPTAPSDSGEDGGQLSV